MLLRYACLRRSYSQMFPHSDFVCQAGDFNSIPTTLPMTIIRDHAALTDCWSTTHPNNLSSSSGNGNNTIPPPLEAITKYGVTADSPLNSYSAGKPLDPHARQFMGKRLDYIFYRQPNRPYASANDKIPVLRCSECTVVMTEKVQGYDFSFSDHFGLETTLDILTPQVSERQGPSGSTTPNSEKFTELTSASLSTTIQALTACYRVSRHRSSRELAVFALCVILLVAMVVGSSWLPHAWINPIILLATVFFSWLGTTMLYEGFLFGNWERNALMNVIEELEIHRKGLDETRRGSRSSTSY